MKRILWKGLVLSKQWRILQKGSPSLFCRSMLSSPASVSCRPNPYSVKKLFFSRGMQRWERGPDILSLLCCIDKSWRLEFLWKFNYMCGVPFPCLTLHVWSTQELLQIGWGSLLSTKDKHTLVNSLSNSLIGSTILFNASDQSATIQTLLLSLDW